MKANKILMFITIISVLSCENNTNKSDAYGNFEAIETIISSELSGKLINLDITEGEKLTKNQIVGLIDTTQLRLNYKLLYAKKEAVKTKLSNIDAQVSVFLAQKKSILTELNRVKKLIKAEASSKQKLDDLEGKIEVIKSQINSTKVQKKSIYAEMSTIDSQIQILEDQLEKCNIINPVNGTVLEKYLEQHELTFPGKSIYKIADLSAMELRVYLSGAMLSKIKIGQKVQVLIDKNSKENSELSGTISWISQKAEFTPKIIQTKEERVNLVYAVKVRVKNDGSIKIGMPGEIKFLQTQSND